MKTSAIAISVFLAIVALCLTLFAVLSDQHVRGEDWIIPIASAAALIPVINSRKGRGCCFFRCRT